MELPKLRRSKAEAKSLIGEQIKKVRDISPLHLGYEASVERFDEWDKETYDLLVELFDTNQYAEEFKRVTEGYDIGDRNNRNWRLNFGSRTNRKVQKLEEFGRRIDKHLADPTLPATGISQTPVDLLNLICSRFHAVVRQLRKRHGGRPTLTVDDEYDVQDLLHALLKIYFSDIRPEDPSPKRAGMSSRTDFVLKIEQIVVEVKMTRDTLTERELAKQLIIDIELYRSHPDCKLLYCFVYDPSEYISNPVGLENDLSRTEENLTVKVYVAPKH